MILEQYIGELIVGVGTAVSTWFISRHKQRVDQKKIEIEILEKALQILEKDVVQPLRNELKTVREESEKVSKALKTLQHAISKMYGCHSLPTCPVRIFLRDQENSSRKGKHIRQPTNRQREPGSGEPD